MGAVCAACLIHVRHWSLVGEPSAAFMIDGLRGVVLLSTSLWMPLLTGEAHTLQGAWVEIMQALGLVNSLAVMGLYLLQRSGSARTAAV